MLAPVEVWQPFCSLAVHEFTSCKYTLYCLDTICGSVELRFRLAMRSWPDLQLACAQLL
jgi:hypothetical protein